MRGKILVIRGGAIGDFILTLPAIAALRAQFPQAHLELLGYPHIAQLALAAGLVDRIQPIEARALAGFFARNGSLEEDLIDYFSEFDLIISFLYDPDRIFEQNVALCTAGQFIAGPHRAVDSGGVHAAQVYLKPLERLAIFEADPVPKISFGQHLSPQHQVALHPGSGSELKNWPEAKWQELVRYLIAKTNYRFLLVGGEAEGERLQRLSRAIEPVRGRLHIAQSLPLVELATLFQSCELFVGHDSGISHLAAAVGLPSLILWGHTSEEVWRPPGQRIRVLKHPLSLEKLSVETVLDAFMVLENQVTEGGSTSS
jgi:ADP-heptose:LPS heptosyltransferase